MKKTFPFLILATKKSLRNAIAISRTALEAKKERERAKRKNDAKEEVYLFRLTKLLSFR